MRAGASLDKVEALPSYATSPHYSPRERLALEFADRMTYSDQDVDDAFFARLTPEFSSDELVELAAVIAFENYRSKFNNAFRIEAQGFCALPPQLDSPPLYPGDAP